MKTRNRLTAVALAAACANGAFAMDVAGFEFTGYSRGGPVFNHTDGVKGNLALGGELLVATHLPFPSVGRVAVEGDAFRWVASFWDY